MVESKCWWANGVFTDKNGEVFFFSVDVPEFVEGETINAKLNLHKPTGYELKHVTLTFDYYPPFKWSSESPPTIIRNSLMGDGSSINKNAWNSLSENSLSEEVEISEEAQLQLDKLKANPKYKQAILLLREVWDDLQKDNKIWSDDKLVQEVWLAYTDMLDVIRGEM